MSLQRARRRRVAGYPTQPGLHGSGGGNLSVPLAAGNKGENTKVFTEDDTGCDELRCLKGEAIRVSYSHELDVLIRTGSVPAKALEWAAQSVAVHLGQ
jgi:hypothetical protein